MKTADLYIRVSTDEQADKGYSQRNQDELLHKYCHSNGIRVQEIIYEDHSAKTFNRPEWRKILARFKKARVNPDLILFTKWDRFSRNTSDAYQMIALLRTYDIEPQAIEQPLDLSIPENKMMLAFYLAAPEVENDRRALNIFHGMRRARKEGRWIASAPVGYINKSYEDGRKYIAVNEPQAVIMRDAFQEIATGKYTVEQIWKVAKGKGLACGRNNFWNLIRNPVYCGKIVVPLFKDEPMHWVEAQHQPIITEAVFHRVQQVLDGRKRHLTKIVSPGRLLLRGFLKCPKCTRMLTGSPSKGSRNYYYYYHCSSACGVRFNADQVNAALIKELKRYTARPEFMGLFKKIVADAMEKKNAVVLNKQRLASKQLDDQQSRLNKAKDLLLSGDLDTIDYRSIKTEAENKIVALQHFLAAIADPQEAVATLLKRHDKVLLNLAFLYKKANVANKRKMIGLLFPGNLTYTSDGFEDGQMGNTIMLIYNKR
ncbi:MAG: recombinase family protein [Mucilaginibacter sp.]|uniref:recombinase family protein n=1 Tax=Mucilaginibacter sp. TaxID=1882438 RepID=UPI0032676083